MRKGSETGRKGSRKIGRNSTKSARYKSYGTLEKNKERRRLKREKKFARNKEKRSLVHAK